MTSLRKFKPQGRGFKAACKDYTLFWGYCSDVGSKGLALSNKQMLHGLLVSEDLGLNLRNCHKPLPPNPPPSLQRSFQDTSNGDGSTMGVYRDVEGADSVVRPR